jgi:hypothetical protein
MNRQAYLLSAAGPHTPSAIDFKPNSVVVEVAYSWFFKQSQKRLFVQAVLGKICEDGAAADMLIFDTLLVGVSREPAVSLFEICYLVCGI